MIKKNILFDFLTQLMVIWGITMLSLCFFCIFFGESAKGYSSIFTLGSKGISIATFIQFFCLAVILASLRTLFFTDLLIKKLNIAGRSVCMFACIIFSIGIFAYIFEWFPVNQVKPWIMFFICFFICATISVIVSVLKEKSDNKKMHEALERLKGEDFHE
ncbi:MAG: hypothetical protein K2N51_19385 [Lachnospiraceae bacterium]|nr:hypothetical protein [Lachnospiraceae bacterium]